MLLGSARPSFSAPRPDRALTIPFPVFTLDLTTLAWTVRPTGELAHIPPDLRACLESPVPARVPGCIHQDLLAASVLADPRLGMNEAACQWVSLTDWRYEAHFHTPPALHAAGAVELACECLDTIAAIELNGLLIGQTASEFIPWRFDITSHLRDPARGEPNSLTITFKSPLRHIREEAQRLGPRPVNGDWDPFVFARKSACNFGWDWGPNVATCGITGAISISGDHAPASQASPPVRAVKPVARLRVSSPDADDTFAFERDGERIFCLGANWIPEGLFPAHRTPEIVRARLRAAKDCGMNTIRVWGGGRYEPDWFYDLCDELGLMVWQDFMFACGSYPEEEPFPTLIEAEARHHVARLAAHPCVVVWCGANECSWAHESWGFKEKLLPGQTWGENYWHTLLPSIVSAVDPARPYWPDSPWSGNASIHPNDPHHGDRHSWDINFWDAWSGGYQKLIPRYCSEFGQQSPSSYATLREAGLLPSSSLEASRIPDAAQGTPAPACSASWSTTLMGPALAHRQRGPGGNARWYDESLDALFRRPADFDQWHHAAQLLQARSLRTAIEWHRVNRPRCHGALLWQLNDAWPGLSWSIIDSAGRPKPAYHAVQAAMQPRILSFHLVDGQVCLFAANDTDQTWEELPTLRLLSFTGDIIHEWTCTVRVEPRSAGRVAQLGPVHDITRDPSRQFLAARSAHGDAEWYFLPDKELRYPAPEFKKLVIKRTPTGARVYLRALTLVRDLTCPADRLHPEAVCDAGITTLLPTERLAFSINAPDLSSELFRYPVEPWKFLRCANHLGRRVEGPLD